MKTIFISQPMNGKTDDEILLERENAVLDAQRRLGGEGVYVIDSFFQAAPHDVRPLWFLGKSIELLSAADVAYFVPGWEKARGCKIEHDCALQYGIQIIDPDRGEENAMP